MWRTTIGCAGKSGRALAFDWTSQEPLTGGIIEQGSYLDGLSAAPVSLGGRPIEVFPWTLPNGVLVYVWMLGPRFAGGFMPTLTRGDLVVVQAHATDRTRAPDPGLDGVGACRKVA